MENFKNEFKDYIRKLSNDKSLLIKAGVIVLVILIAIMIRISNSNNNDITIEASSNSDEVVETTMYVDISGEVKHPGVYQFETGTRLYEVIDKAGGLTKNADKNSINQAEFIEDGEKVVIPALTGDEETYTNTEGKESNNKGLINLNTASKEELMNITGVGEVIAGRIIEYRESNRFKSIEEVMNVKGIGNATFKKMKSQITV